MSAASHKLGYFVNLTGIMGKFITVAVLIIPSISKEQDSAEGSDHLDHRIRSKALVAIALLTIYAACA